MTMLEIFVKRQMERARRLLEAAGSHPPMLVWQDARDRVDGLAVPQYGNPALKETLRVEMRQALADGEAERYVFIMEAWMLDKRHTPNARIEIDVLPSRSPDRKECVSLIGADRNGEMLCMMALIHRVGQKAYLLTPETTGGKPLELWGPMAHLFEAEERAN